MLLHARQSSEIIIFVSPISELDEMSPASFLRPHRTTFYSDSSVDESLSAAHALFRLASSSVAKVTGKQTRSSEVWGGLAGVVGQLQQEASLLGVPKIVPCRLCVRRCELDW